MTEDASARTSTMIVDSEEGLHVLLQSLKDAGRFALDTETSSEDARHAELVGISLSMAPGEAYYIPVGHRHTPDGQEPGAQLPRAYVIEKLTPVLEDETILQKIYAQRQV